jgi:spore maturation protein CgeB
MNRVLIIGNSFQLGRTEEVYARGFRARGCEVRTCLLEDYVAPGKRSLWTRALWRVAEARMLGPFNEAVVDLASSFRPDLVFVVSARVVAPSTLSRLQESAPVFTFFTDNPLDGHHTHRSRFQDATLSKWDAVLIWSERLAKELKLSGVRKAVFHPFCCDTQYLSPVSGARPECDVVFLANWDPGGKRERFLKAIEHVKIHVWGQADWLSRSSLPLGDRYKGMNRYEDLPRLVASGKLALNVMRAQNLMGHNLRSYEIVACGGLMLSERTPELPALFSEDEEAVYFSTPEELRQKVDWLLAHPETAKRIAQKAHAKAEANGIEARIRQIEGLFTESKRPEGRLSKAK